VSGTGEFSLSRVPQGATYSGWRIALVVIGGTISIPGFLMAAQIGAAMGLVDAAKAFALGCLVLGTLGAATGVAGQRSGLSAHMLGQFAFGRMGGRAASLTIALSLVGWFGVISNIFGLAAHGLAQSILGGTVPVAGYIVGGGLLITGVTAAGFKGLDRLALILVPVMFSFLLLAAWLSFDKVGSWVAPEQASLSVPVAVSAVVGSYIAGVAIQPDYARFAPSRRAALTSAFFALAVSFPVVLLCTAVPSVAASESDLFLVMTSLGIGIPAFLLLGLAAWSSNVLCMYSAALSFVTLFATLRFAVAVVGIGVVGTGLALANVQEWLTHYLVILGIAIPPIVGIFAAEALLFGRDYSPAAYARLPGFRWPAMSGWMAGIAAGTWSYMGGFSPTRSPALDSVGIALATFLIVSFCRGKSGREPDGVGF